MGLERPIVLLVAWAVCIGSSHAVTARPEFDPPPAVAAARDAAFGPWAPTEEELQAAEAWGRRLAAAGKTVADVQAPWRIVVDKDGEYAVVLTPACVVATLAYEAEERQLPDKLFQQKREKLLERFGSGICLGVILRSYAHESRGFGSAGQIRPGTPGQVCDALFLLDTGARKYEGTTPQYGPELAGMVKINRHGLRYLTVDLPEVHGHSTLFGEQTTGRSYGADYYVWWSFKDEEGEPAFGQAPTSLRLTIVTPGRKREYMTDVAASPVSKASKRQW